MAKRKPSGKKTLNTNVVKSKMQRVASRLREGASPPQRKPTRAKKTPPHWDKGEKAEPETSVVDETIPAHEAITQASEQVNGEATQLQLMDMSKPFNAEGAWTDVAQKANFVSQLEREHKDDAERAKRSKKALEEEEALLRRMIATYEGRRQQIERDAQRRAESAESAEALVVQLSALGVMFDVASVAALAETQRQEIRAWVLDAEAHLDERERWIAATPTVLVKSDAAPEPVDDAGGEVDAGDAHQLDDSSEEAPL